MRNTLTPTLRAEIEALLDADGYSGDIFVVDDAVIGYDEAMRRGLIPRAASIRDERVRDAGMLPLSSFVSRTYGSGLLWGGNEDDLPYSHVKRPGPDRDEIIGTIIGALIVVAVAAGLAWFAFRQMGGGRW